MVLFTYFIALVDANKTIEYFCKDFDSRIPIPAGNIMHKMFNNIVLVCINIEEKNIIGYF